jgi:hypothetical protein
VARLEGRSPEQAIANFAELRRRFAGGPWAAFFAERVEQPTGC